MLNQGVESKTPPDDESGGVDFSWNKQLVNQAEAHGHTATLPSQNQPKSVSDAKGAGQKLDRITDFSYPGSSQVDHSCRPIMGTNEYRKDYDPEGKVGSSCLFQTVLAAQSRSETHENQMRSWINRGSSSESYPYKIVRCIRGWEVYLYDTHGLRRIAIELPTQKAAKDFCQSHSQQEVNQGELS
jgi:hypothetical protein